MSPSAKCPFEGNFDAVPFDCWNTLLNEENWLAAHARRGWPSCTASLPPERSGHIKRILVGGFKTDFQDRLGTKGTGMRWPRDTTTSSGTN